MYADFEEKTFEVAANLELGLLGPTLDLWAPGQVLEGVLGFDVMVELEVGHDEIDRLLDVAVPPGLFWKPYFGNPVGAGSGPEWASLFLSTVSWIVPLVAVGCPRGWPCWFPGDGHGIPRGGRVVWMGGQVSGWTPFPSAASVRRTLSPVVTRTWAWCMSRSTRADAMVRGMSSSKPEGWMLVEMATERRS